MKFFIDTANLEQIKEAQALGILDGVTTNPSLMAKEGITGQENIINHYKTICELVDGDVSAEVISTDFDGMVKEGEALAALNPQIVVKLPMIKDGVKACKYFSSKGIKTNVTLVFSVGQALLAAKAGAKVICVDIAHGHHALMRHALKTLRNTLGNCVHIMAGNVATLEAFNDLSDWGADSIRVGIGGGSICSTRIQTGHGMPTLQSVIDCARSDRDVALIADGGIRTSGDIVKALAAGADFVMLGSLLAGTEESPADTVFAKGGQRKVYRGMASKDAQLEWRGHAASEEGVSSTVPYKGDLKDVLDSLEKGIRSGLSYTGAHNLVELRAKAKFIKQSSAGQKESFTHIMLNDV